MTFRPHDPERLFDLDLVRCTEKARWRPWVAAFIRACGTILCGASSPSSLYTSGKQLLRSLRIPVLDGVQNLRDFVHVAVPGWSLRRQPL